MSPLDRIRWAGSTRGLSDKAKLILLCLATHDGGGGSWPSRATLAVWANCSDATVKRCLVELRTKGIVAVVINGGGSQFRRNDRRPNLYRLQLHAPVDNPIDGGSELRPPATATGAHSYDPDGGSQLCPQRGLTAVSPEEQLKEQKKCQSRESVLGVLADRDRLDNQGLEVWGGTE